MRELILIRHGQAEHHVRGISGGWTDLPLTELGRAQARAVAERVRGLARDPHTSLYSSDLIRARETAGPIALALGVSVQESEALRELNNGVARGLPEAEAAALRRAMTQPALDWIPYDQGESWRMLHRRVSAFLDAVDRREPGTVIAVTHGNALVCAVHWFLQVVDERLLATTMFDAEPGSLTRLRVASDGCRTIGCLNDTSHLP
jgi:probable phosphoglycerate mutase